jgi:hypothetical protein
MFFLTCARKHRIALVGLLLATGSGVSNAATVFDAGASTQWWFNPTNWSTNLLPPNNATNAVTDTWVSLAPGFAGDMGEGVVYDPSTNDPGWTAAQTALYPAGFGPQKIQQLYMTRGDNNAATPAITDSLLTIKGDLEITIGQIGRSSDVADTIGNARVIQNAGKVVDTSTLEIGGSDTSRPGNSGGLWDYRGGILSVSPLSANALRLSHGSTSTNTSTLLPAGTITGPGGVGRMIIHNPLTAGYVRVGNANLASYAGLADTTDGGVTAADPNGTTTGVAIMEYSIDNGATRPLQVTGNVTINNGLTAATSGTRSARLALSITGAVAAPGGVPVNLGLFDVDFDNPLIPDDDFTTGIINGTGTMGGTFSDVTGATQLIEGSMVSATFGATKYNWQISYNGIITWADAELGTLTSVAPGTAGIDKDIILIGVSTETVALPDSADFNGDLKVDGLDFLAWQRGLGGNTFAQGDANHNGVVDNTDLTIWKAKYGLPVAVAAAGAVPEPASATIACLAALSLAAFRRRR